MPSYRTRITCVWVGAISDRSRRGHLQIHGFKHEVGGGCQLDDLTAHQTQFLVVIQHSVHVLNPDGIHGTVKDQPLPVRGLVNNRYT